MFLSKLGKNFVKSGGGLASTCNGVAGIASSRSKYTLPDLPYDYNALEPVISGEIMKLHHQKHHATYVQNLNAAEEKIQTALQKGDLKTAIEQQKALKFNGGGHINHSIFWKNLGPAKDCSQKQPEGDLAAAIKRDFGDVESMKKRLSDKAVAVQGSGWAWLGYCPKSKRLGIVECANQDPLEATVGLIPLLGIDVWEHAYYLQYKNVRADYVKEIWKIVNWSDVAERFGQAASSK